MHGTGAMQSKRNTETQRVSGAHSMCLELQVHQEARTEDEDALGLAMEEAGNWALAEWLHYSLDV